MPFEPISPVGGFTATPELPRPEEEARPDPTFGETLTSAFRTENTIGSLMASQDLADDHITRDPHFDPWAEIADTPYEPYYEQFARARNPMHFQAIKADIDRENTDRDIISRSGFSGVVAPMAAGVLDWPTLLPGGALVRTAKGGISLLRSSASVAAAGAAGAAVSEAALQGTQQLRTSEESAVVIGGSAILAGALGAGLAKLVSRGELDALAPRVERDFVVPGADQPDVFEPGSMRPSVEAATGASPRAMEVADAIRQAAEEILPPQVRVQVVDTLGAPGDEGLFAIRAFHGTPHDFDRFDMGKIGTGEGAQVFGHGLYFAENEAVAKGYREALSPTLLDGVDVGTRSRERTYGKLKEEGKLDEEIARQRGLVQKILDDPELTPSRREALAKQIDELDVMERVKRAEVSLGGKLYEVEIKADHEDLLDLDAPLSKQPPRVQEAIRKLGFELVEYRDGHWLQKEIWRHADDYINENHWGKPGFDVDAETSKRLREAGIPGLRYLDQGSRNAGDGTRNIVIFDDSLVKITKKNGEPVTAAERKAAVDQLFGVRQSPTGPIAEGRFAPQQLLITIAADALDPAKTLRHESIHALKQMGLFTPKQWKTLEAAAKKESWLDTHNVRALYEDLYSGRSEGTPKSSLRSMFGRKSAAEVGNITDGFDRAASRTLRSDGSIIAGRLLREQGGSQPLRTTAPVRVDGFDGFVEALKAPNDDYLAKLLYRFFPEGSGNDAKLQGYVDLVQHKDGAWEVRLVEKAGNSPGFAKSAYKAIEDDLGIKLAPSGWLTQDGYQKIWKRLNPDAVKWWRWSEHDEHYLSPRQIGTKLEETRVRLETGSEKGASRLRDQYAEYLSLWRSLPREAKSSSDSMFSIRGNGASPTASRNADPRLEALLLEEAIAEQFSLWRQGAKQVNGALAEIFRQMQLFLERTGNVLRGRGFQTADDVFEAVRGGYVASRAQPPAASPAAAAATATGRATSVGASAVQRAEDTLKSAFGAEKAFRFQDPMIRLQTSQSPVARRTVQELAETPLTYDKNALGEPTAPLGSEMGAPGSVETRIKFWQGPLAEAMQSVDNAFLMYRKGRAKRFTGEVPALTLKDTLLGTDALTYRDFKGEIAKALRRGDESPIPEVAGAARIIRQRVLDPLKDEAIAAKLLPEDVSVETAESYLNRLYNKERIIAERDQFKAVVSDWLQGQESINVGVRTRLAPMLDRHELLEERVSKYERQLERLQQSSAKIEARRQEASGLNRFAFQRAEKLSKPIDETRAEIDTISTKIAAELERIDDLATSIREEKAKFPELQTLERQAVRLAHAAAKVKRDAALIDVVDGADEIEASLSDLNDTLKAVQTFYRKEAQAMRAEDWAKPLVSLEKQRAKLSKEIAPFRKKLTELRTLQRKMEKARVPGARGGAVFESKIRSRVNKLADQESGKKAQIDALRAKLTGAQDALKTVKGDIETEVTKYQGKSAKEAVTAIAGREKTNLLREEKRQAAITRRDELQKLIAGSGDTPNLPAVASAKQELALLEKQVKPLRPLASADKPVLAAARRIASQLDKEPGEIGDLADQIIDRIIGHPDGRLPYDAHMNTTTRGGVAMDARGPLAARQFMIPDAAIERWLESDIETLLRAYTRTMAPDVELTKRFGDVNLQQQMRELEEDYAKRSARATTPAERKKVNAQLDRDKKDLAAIRDRMRGTYNLPSDPNSLMVRAGRVVSSLNYMRMLGGMTLSAIPDVGGVVFAHGLQRVFGDGIIPLFRNWSGARIAMNEVKMAGTALDMVLDSRAMQIADIMDDFGRHTKFERAVSSAARNFGVVSLMAPWNAAMKQFTGLVTMTRMLRAIERAANGKAKPKEIERLAAGGISQADAKKIGEQFAKHGKKGGGVWFANTAEWDEGARSAVEAFRAALVRDVDRTIITPGQDRPLWMSSEIGRLVGQFKSFAISAMQRVVIAGLQQRDMATLSGAALMTALGGLSGILKAKVAGQPGHTDWSDPKKNAQFLVEAIDRSGLTGWLMDVNSMTEKLTRGAVGLSAVTGKPVSRYAQRNIASTLFGPTAGTIQEFARVGGAAASGEWNQSDSRAMRRLIPYNNIFYLRQMFDQAEGGINDFLGVPKAAGARR